MSFAAIQENNGGNSTVNKHSCNLATGKERDGTSSNSSRGKHKTNNVEKIDSELPFEGKTACNFNHKGDPLESLWIARFTPKTSGSLLNQDPSKKSTGESLNCSSDGQRQKPELQSPLGSFDENENEELLHVRNCEAMASVFARRLDALRHFMPSDEPENAACATMTCLFCGIKGHHLQECSEITDTELEDLLRNINSYNWVNELPCVCIRCFQLNHWAVACPDAFSRVGNQAEYDASLVNQCGPSKMQLNVSIEDNPKLRDIAAGPLTVCDRNDSGMEKDLNLTQKWNVEFFGKEIASSSREKKLKENLMEPLYELVNDEISDVPKGIFDAIRRLHLLRTDILNLLETEASADLISFLNLKLISINLFLSLTDFSMLHGYQMDKLPHALSRLDGFFLRVRLGKWQEGLGGTGYYVACITGAQVESSPQNSKKSIAVNVGGIKCLVETQHVSNHDFLEDELVAWWSATSRSGGNLPSKEELRLKAEEKKMLGF
ncbi:hypothetical protein GH714_020749 [Hevea brasiliensis]|uniref:Plus3 domain-containing protein n=1 Tax=Hevea brasiliensis TaxID=3981 RepID=A0A6A6MJL3_HEVBR|nr:hypothetical protein GH714_020749 [Hevea brasiliensis]